MDIVKTCKTHGALTFQEVYTRKNRKGMECRHCHLESQKKARLANPERYKEHSRKQRYIEIPEETAIRKCSGCQKDCVRDEFTTHAWKRKHPYCKFCSSDAGKKSKEKNPETYEAYKIRASELSRRSYLKKVWGITLEEFNRLSEAQDGKCAICKKIPKVLYIDHDHSTGKQRELLCNSCNRGIGFFKESLEIMQSVMDYLIRHKQ